MPKTLRIKVVVGSRSIEEVFDSKGMKDIERKFNELEDEERSGLTFEEYIQPITIIDDDDTDIHHWAFDYMDDLWYSSDRHDNASKWLSEVDADETTMIVTWEN